MSQRNTLRVAAGALSGMLLVSPAAAGDWVDWRGPGSRGYSPETDLISSWSLDGENLIWRHDFTGRSTPVVFDGRVCFQGRVGDGISKQEQVACYAASDGRLLWEHRFNVFLTTVPHPRVGWANPAFDPETGNLYVHGVAGQLFCFDPTGTILWERSMSEEFGAMSGYGGRTHTPVVDGDLVIWSSVTSSWGEFARPLHRYYAFDKRHGELRWVATPGGAVADLNTYSTPVVGDVGGVRLLVAGNADGAIYAMKIGTGETVWKFQLSKRGINSSPVLVGDRVYAAHSEENIDSAPMGRLVCIDATGSGDVTASHEVWRHPAAVGFTSPAVHDGSVYIIDNSANLFSLDAATGREQWEANLGTVGKGSPVWADGKLYVTETNGIFSILRPEAHGAEVLSRVAIRLEAEDRMAEIYSSPVISGGRIFFATEEGVYALGRKDRPFDRGEPAAVYEAPRGEGPPARIQIMPTDVTLFGGETADFRVEAFDARGLPLGPVSAEWSLDGVEGEIGPDGSFSGASRDQGGHLVATVASLTDRARLRVIRRPPWTEDFEAVEIGSYPGHWMGAAGKFDVVEEEDGNRLLVKRVIRRGIQRAYVLFGKTDMKGYTIQVDAKGTDQRRRVPDMGLIADRYILILNGSDNEIQTHSWASELRMEQKVPFQFEPEVWYTIKMQVEASSDRAIIRGKVWKRDEPEPAEWSLVAEDPYPNREGTPGLYGQSYAEIYYDNLKVTPNP